MECRVVVSLCTSGLGRDEGSGGGAVHTVRIGLALILVKTIL